jgi:Calcineurin-like phosphoesterase
MKRIFLLLALLFSVIASAEEPRIVAIGDVHGDLNAFSAILQSAGLIDQNQNWSGGKSIFVQIGDILDRGTKGRQSLDLMMKLENQARKKGGKVYALLGNHEVMNMMGDLRYVPEDEYANFADAGSQQKLDHAYEAYRQLQIQKAARLKFPTPEFTEQTKQEWMKAHPAGFLEHREAYAPDGKYGKWLRSHSAVLDLSHNIFVHGGISSRAATMSVQELNQRIHQELELFDRIQKTFIDQKIILPFFKLEEMLAAAGEELKARQKDQTLEVFLNLPNWLSVSAEGPLWFRGYTQESDDEIKGSLPVLENAYHAQHIIVGHTVQQNGEIHSRENMRLIMIDTGLNSAFYPGGRASALEIIGQKLTAIYGEARILLNSNQ